MIELDWTKIAVSVKQFITLFKQLSNQAHNKRQQYFNVLYRPKMEQPTYTFIYDVYMLFYIEFV